MINLKDLKKGKINNPDRILLYGMPKIGKSTFASKAKNPIFLNIEDGIDNLDVTRVFDTSLKTYDTCIELLERLISEEHDFKTLVIDSADWLERVIYKYICKKEKVESIEDIGYGKGYVEAMSVWSHFLAGLDTLRLKRGMEIIFICHVDIRNFNDPAGENYNHYVPKLHGRTGKGDSALGLLTEWSDMILFAVEKKFTKETDVGFGGKEVKAISAGERIIHTVGQPSFIAGNRINLPAELPLSYKAFDEARTKCKG